MDAATPVALREPAIPLCPRVITYWMVPAAASWSLALLGQLITLFFIVTPAQIAAIPITTAVAIGHVFLLPRNMYRRHRWELTPEALYSLNGWLTRHSYVIPITRIQTVESTRNPLQHHLGLATVVITTASAEGPVEISGLDTHDARQLVADLARITDTHPGDAT